jgi:hypothetical protein
MIRLLIPISSSQIKKPTTYFKIYVLCRNNNCHMKYSIPGLLLCFLSFAATAQPLINNPEGYNYGDLMFLADCPPVAAGPSGPSQLWNFSGLTSTGLVTLSILPVPATSIYKSGSNMMEEYSDGVSYFMQTSPIQDYIAGMTDTTTSSGGSADSVTYPDAVLAVVRPFTYTSNASGPFTLHTTYYPGVTGPVSGTGSISLTGDGYGTLVLPDGVYNNVLRVMINEQSTYRLGSGGSMKQTIHTYKWYNNSSAAPLLRIDSLVVTYLPLSGSTTTSSDITVRYLMSKTNILGIPQNVNNIETDVRTNIDHDQLSLFANFDAGKQYEVTLYNSLGTEVFKQSFTATTEHEYFNLAKLLSPGMYILSLSNKNEPASTTTIKVIKQ